MKERLKKKFLEIGKEVEGMKVGVDDVQEVKKHIQQMYGRFVLV